MMMQIYRIGGKWHKPGFVDTVARTCETQCNVQFPKEGVLHKVIGEGSERCEKTPELPELCEVCFSRAHATYYVTKNPDGSISLLYKKELVKFNDGTTALGLSYFSSFKTWQGSGDPKRDELLAKLEPVTPEFAMEFIRGRTRQ